MDRIFRINMSSLKVSEEKVSGDYSGLGGRGLTSMVVSKEVPPLCHPIGQHNKLVITPGLLTGTTAANSGRLSIGAKSPLTGGIKESNVGGTAATKLARLGIAAIIIEGKPEKGKLYGLAVSKDGAKLFPADDLKGLGNYELVEKLQAKYDKKAGVISIGPAGEMKMAMASIAVTSTNGYPSRHAGRGGMGAVMGSKGLKAIVVDDTGAEKVAIKNPDLFKEASQKFVKALREHPVTSEGLPKYGTNVLAGIINEAGGYPTRNFSLGRFEGTDKISGETMHDVISKRGGKTTHSGCTTCIIQCSNEYVDEKGKYITSGLEYETIWANGANCGIDDLDAIANIDRLCDDYGFDTIEMGCTIGVAMEAGVKEFGDAKGAIALIHEAGKGTPLGRIIGNGAGFTGKAFGVTRVPVVKNQGMPAYDPRAVQGIGVTYATSTMGADHTAGYATATNIMKVGGFVDPLKPDGQVALSQNLQITTAAVDSAGLCLFIAFPALDIPECFEGVIGMLNGRYGWNLTANDVAALGKKILKVERDFNERAGFSNLDDRLPEFFREEKLPPHNLTFLVPDVDLDKVFEF
ncbi:MAG TPA: aldehyde ferredoxin oxidoreductase C-terminal domain-containing protein [Thermodesulfobacteriota bacterium]|nr:aldehyde ferredoxin oxidoreductase C-terminal domain-containing protein [Thermodesulfobacteriota bacterium]